MCEMVSIIIATIAFATDCINVSAVPHASYSIASCGVSSFAAGHSLRIDVSCPRGLPYRISLLQQPRCGLLRAMTSARGARKIHYVLLTPNRSSVWCDGTNGTVAVKGVGTGVSQEYIAVSSVLEKRVGAALPNTRDYADTVVVYVESP